MKTRRYSRRRVLGLFSAGAMGLVLAACAPQEAPAPEKVVEKEVVEKEVVVTATPAPRGKVTMTVWTNDRLYTQDFQNRSADFAAMHPGADFEFVIEENPDLWDNIANLLIGGVPGVDVVAIEQSFMCRLWKGGLAENTLVDLKELLTPEEIDGYSRWEMFSWKGKVYGVSSEMDLCAWYYQPAIFEQYGIDVNEIKTYQDLVVLGQKLAQDGKYMLTVGTTSLPSALVTQNGGGIFDCNGKVLIDSPETIEAVQLLYDMAVTDKVAHVENDMMTPAGMKPFADGLVAGVIGADWFADYYLKDLLPDMAGKWRIQPLPLFKEGGLNTATDGGTGLCIPKTSEHADLALDFIRATYMDKENQIKIFLETHYFPPLRACWDDSRILNYSDPYFGTDPIGGVWAAMAPNTPLDCTHEYKAEARDIINKDAMAPIFNGEKSVEQGLKDAAQAVRQLIG